MANNINTPTQVTTFANATPLNTLSGSYVVKANSTGLTTVQTDINTISPTMELFIDRTNSFGGVVNGSIYDITSGTSWKYKDQYYDEESETTYLRYERLSTINSRIINLGNILNKYFYVTNETEQILTENITIDLEKIVYFLKEDVEELPIHPIDYLLCRNYLYEVKEIGKFFDDPEEEYPGCNITLKCCAIYNGEDLSLPLSIINGGTGKGDFFGGSVLYFDYNIDSEGNKVVFTRELNYEGATDEQRRVVLGNVRGSGCNFFPLHDGVIIGSGYYADYVYSNNQIPINDLQYLLDLHNNVYLMPGLYTLIGSDDSNLNLTIYENNGKIACFGNGQVIFRTLQNRSLHIDISDNYKLDLFNLKFNCNVGYEATVGYNGTLNCTDCDFQYLYSGYLSEQTISSFTNCTFSSLRNINTNNFSHCIVYNLLDSTYGNFNLCNFIQPDIQLIDTNLVNCLLVCESYQKNATTVLDNCQQIQTTPIS